MEQGDFYTLRGYNRMEKTEISPAMEDYLEMIFRLGRQRHFVRVNQLAAQLNVTPPSASKMVAKLREQRFVDFEPYGIIQLTRKGEELGGYLFHRHTVLHRFFCMVNGTEEELELVEKIEHFLDRRTVDNLEKWMQDAQGNG